MHRSLFLFGLALAQAFAAPLSAADQHASPAALSMADALDRAWARVPAAAALPHRRAEAHALARAVAGWTPGPATFAVANRNDRLSARDGRQEWELEVATPLWLPGQRDAQRAQAQSRQESLSAHAAAQRLELAGQVREAWWHLAGATDAVAVAARRVQAAQALRDDVERRLRAGDLARVDANGARAEVQAAEAEWVDAQAEQRRAVSAWRVLTGTSPPAAFVEEAAAPGPGAYDAHGAHPRLVAANAAVDAALSHLRVAERSQREAPELALRWARERGSGAEPYARSVGIELRFPLSSGPKVAADLSGVRAELSQAQAQQLLLREQLQAEAQSARRDLESIEASLALFHVRELLHHAQRAHGHEVARQAEALGTVDRQVVDAGLQGRIGQLACGMRHLACGRRGRLLRRQQARSLLRKAQRPLQAQGSVGLSLSLGLSLGLGLILGSDQRDVRAGCGSAQRHRRRPAAPRPLRAWRA